MSLLFWLQVACLMFLVKYIDTKKNTLIQFLVLIPFDVKYNI